MTPDPIRRALLVDDDDFTTTLLQDVLQDMGWAAEICPTGLDAAAALRREPFDLVVANFFLPGLSGIELYESATRLDPRLKRRFLYLAPADPTPAMRAFLENTRCSCLTKPLDPEQFESTVLHIVKEKPLTGLGPLEQWFRVEMKSLYSGEITGRHTLFRLLHTTYIERLTGVLHVVLGRVEKKLYFNRGNIIFAASNLYDEALGEMMLRAGAITQRDYEDAASRVTPGSRFGAMLVEMGLCDAGELRQWVQEQITQIAVSAFDYPAGRYYFFDTFEEDLAPEVGIALPVGQLLLHAARTTPDLPFAELAAESKTPVDESSDPLLRFQDVALNDAERAVLLTINRPLPAKDLLEQTALPGERGARALYALLALGIVATVTPGAEAPSAEVVEPSAARVMLLDQPEEFEAEMKRLLELAERGNFYELLGAAPAAPTAEIQLKFNSLARIFHPDRHQGRSEWIGSLQQLMETLMQAYRTLSDTGARASYDRELAEAAARATAAEAPKKETGEMCFTQAMQCLCLRDTSGAVAWLRHAVEIEPKAPKFRMKLARLLAALPQYRHEAPEHYERVIEIDPVNTAAYFLLGEYYMEQQLPWRARPYYEKILELDPEHAKARHRINAIDPKPEEKSAPLVSRLFRRKSE